MLWFTFIYYFFLILKIVNAERLKPLNLRNGISVAFSKVEPFVYQDANGKLKGLDISIIENFAQANELRVKYIEYNGSLNEVLNREYSLDNVLLKRNLQKFDILMGGLGDNLNANKYFVTSRPYYHDIITWCVRTKQPIPSYRNFQHLCRHADVLLIHTFMCVCVVFTGYFIQQFEDLKPKWDWFRLTMAGWAPCLGFASEYAPKILPNRIFFICCVFGATLFYIVISSLLFLLLTIPIFENQIETIEEMIDNEFELAGDGFALQHLKTQHQKYPTKFIDQFTTCKSLDTCLSQLDENPKLAVAISREHSLNNHLIPPSHLYCFEKSEIIHSYHVKFLLNREFKYQKELNRFIQMSSAHGHIGKWYSNNRIRAPDEHMEKEYGIITIENVGGLIILGIILQFLLIVFLFLEKFVHSKLQNSKLLVWKWIEILIDPYRHFWLENKGSWL